MKTVVIKNAKITFKMAGKNRYISKKILDSEVSKEMKEETAKEREEFYKKNAKLFFHNKCVAVLKTKIENPSLA